MQTWREAFGTRGLQYRARLIDAEGTAIAKDVGPLRVRGTSVQHGCRHQRQVSVTIASEPARHDVGPQPRALVSEPPRHVEAANFTVSSELIARLDLDRGHTARAEFSYALTCALAQLLPRR